ncbi:hypothetical protein IKJ53_05680 [bacterium]|nr:hypothetical protein [bacterium]
MIVSSNITTLKHTAHSQEQKLSKNIPLSYELGQDRVCFKGKIQEKNDNKNFFQKILQFFNFSIDSEAANQKESIENDDFDEILAEWNPENRGYKTLTNAGFSEELIDKAINKMEKKDSDILKIGLNKSSIKDSEEMLSDIYDGLNNSLKNEEESAVQTFKLLSKIFEQRSEGRIYIHSVRDAIKANGIDVYKKGKLNDGGFLGDNFAFVDKSGKNILDFE